jgi:hypothetical protein
VRGVCGAECVLAVVRNMDEVLWARKKTRRITLVAPGEFERRMELYKLCKPGQVDPRLFEPLENVSFDITVRPIRFSSHAPMRIKR